MRSRIDYTLPALGGCFGAGCKVAFGYDLVGDSYSGLNTPVPDDDPLDCHGHGTHVAGIIAASDDPYVLGVAPNATLGIYKVFGCTGNVANDVLITAFLMAYNHGVDIITSSIGGANGWPEEPWSAVTASIVAAGTPCMLAAGNDGSNGMYYASSASDGTDVTSVGSVDNTHTPQLLAAASLQYIVAGEATTAGYTPGIGDFTNISLPLYVDTFDINVANDFCSAVTGDLTKKLALIRRGGCTFDIKAQNAFNAGALYVMFYNNVARTLIPSLSIKTIEAAGMVDSATGDSWVKLLEAGKEVTLDFYSISVPLIDSPGSENTLTGGRMSYFTTWSPTNENDIKPVVSAPGGNILSTYLSSQGGYAVESGTSMATPFTAGVVALYLQAQGKGISPKVINAALSGSASPLVFNDGTMDYPYLTSVAQQGGGLINAYAMVRGGIFVTEASLALNDTAHRVKNAAFYVQNNGKSTQTYTLTHAPAVNAYAFDGADTTLVAEFPPPLDTKYATVEISSTSLSIKPGEKKRVTIAASPDPSLNATLVPFYSGYINITGGGESISIPYGGVASVMHDITILALDGPFPYFDGTPFTTDAAGVGTFKPSVGSKPALIWDTRWPTASIRLDVVSVSSKNPVREAGLDIVGSVPGFPFTWAPRGSFMGGAWEGVMEDGTTAPSGTYKFVLRFAKPFADMGKGREYEVYESEVFVMDMS